ncbi:hypothetical protein BGZ54_003738, partial [Gamsiella multidivaricata]
SFYGDIIAFESHVQSHFADEIQPAQRASEEVGKPANGKADAEITGSSLFSQFAIECDAPGCGMMGKHLVMFSECLITICWV